MTKHIRNLPPNLPPGALDRVECADYCHVSATMFDIMMKDGRMPRGFKVGTKRLWLTTDIIKALNALAHEQAADEDGNDFERLLAP